MTDSVAALRHQIDSAEELESVVRTMKAMAASSIGQYENAVRSLDDYYYAVQLGLAACFQQDKSPFVIAKKYQQDPSSIGVIVFGSDQGLVGQFNDSMADFVVASLAKLQGHKTVWVVGERLQSRLTEACLTETGLSMAEGFVLPTSIKGVTALVGKMLIEIDAQRERGAIDQVYLFHHRPQSGSIYVPVSQQLLPFDEAWRVKLSDVHWPTNNLPQLMPNLERTLRALVREYLFVSLFRACAESLASENASRLAAMQRAEKNIDELQDDLSRTFHRLRQHGIDEELFDVISGFEALSE